MAFWDNAKEKLATASSAARQKARDLGDTAKITAQINSDQKHLNNLYAEIGSQYCKMFGGKPNDPFAELVAQVSRTRQSIAQHEDEIRQIKGLVLCPSCGAEVDIAAACCTDCGMRLH